MAKYALLFSGGIERKYNYDRYANDLIFAHKVLTEKLQYLPENIAVLYADGRALNIIHTVPATKDNFLLKMDEYSKIINQNDLFALIVSNHGNQNGDLCTYKNSGTNKLDCIQKDEVTTALNNIACKKIIILGQCYGGNYVCPDVDIKNSVILSANEPNTKSYCKLRLNAAGEFEKDINNVYDEFLYNFFSYYNDEYPCGKKLKYPKTKNSLFAAHEYAKNNDFLLNGRIHRGKIHKEVPCIKDNMNGASMILSL